MTVINKLGASTKGFASLTPERRREIASQGGKAAHRAGTAHQFTSEEARQAVKTRVEKRRLAAQ